MSIDPDLIPTIQPGGIFNALTKQTSLNVRYIAPSDPVYYSVLNRATSDVVVRQLIIAKALDNLDLRLSHQALFPFLITCQVVVGTQSIELPLSWIWDMHVSLPSKWQYIRLAKIKRISGSNGTGSTGSSPTGLLKLVFTAQEKGSSVETAIFEIEYQINSTLTYQYQRVNIVTSSEEPIVIDPGEAATVDGFIIMKTLPLDVSANYNFITSLAPPIHPIDSNSDGIFDVPAIYEIAESDPAGSTTLDFLASSLPHGSGIVVSSAFNAIPATDSSIDSWLDATNYPFRITSNLTSLDGIVVPKGLFREFNIVVPSFDEPTGDNSKLNSPVWLSSIQRLDNTGTNLQMRFSTYTINSTPQIVEFASLNLNSGYTAGTVVKISPIIDLQGKNNVLFQQGFGTGAVVLGTVWGDTTDIISSFFTGLQSLTSSTTTTFTKAAGLLSSFGLSRIPRSTPTAGESAALVGTTARLASPVYPSDSNRFVSEQDQGLGDAVDFRTLNGFADNPDINPIGYSGSLLNKKVRLDIDTSATNHDYVSDVLPRLTCLLGRSPIFGDMLYSGVLWSIYNGDTWQTI